jgi:glycosyltransferase involved in cell wall biosynthesis
MSDSTTNRERSLRLLAIGHRDSPSMRLRVGQYRQAFERDGIDVKQVLLPPGQGAPQTYAAILHREIARSDVVLVQRVLLGWLNLLLRASRKPIVFDLDDATHYVRTSQLAEVLRPRGLKAHATVLYRRAARGNAHYSSRKRLLDQMLQISDGVILGNRNLREELSPRASAETVVVPTSVPVSRRCLKEHVEHSPVTIGWIGMRANLIHLEMLEAAFRSLSRRFPEDIRLHVVSSHPYRSRFVPTDFTTWSLDVEEDAVRGFDIGVMPLVDDFHSRGKCAFKAVLCMSYGVPVVISPVGVNTEIINNGHNGYLASSDQEWESTLAHLTRDLRARERIGLNGFKTAEQRFSTQVAYPAIRAVVEAAASSRLRHERSAGRAEVSR